MILVLQNTQKMLFSQLSSYLNQRIPLIDPQNGNKLDNHLNRYHSPIFSAYLYKRRISQQQIFPKIHIIDDVPIEELPHLSCQSLFPIKNTIDQQMMHKLVKEDSSNINSTFVISVFCKDNFKAMMDEYIKKVLVCGKAPKNYSEMDQIQSKVKQLYRTYFYGEPITPLERQIELKYLSLKQDKFINHNWQFKNGKKNQFTRCKWRDQDQRILEDFVNWRKTDPENDDTNFRPYFESLQLLQRCSTVQKFYSLMHNQNWFDRWRFNRNVKIYYQISSKYFGLIANKIYNRIHQYISSVEFTNLLKIPPDFMIESAIYQLHVWIICQRLRSFGTKENQFIANLIVENLKSRLQNRARKFDTKKQNALLSNIQKLFFLNSGTLKYHFYISSITKDNPYKGIDALVWSIIFFQKVPRYSDQVYLLGEYIVKNYQMIQQYSSQQIINGLIEFDAYLVDPKSRQKIEQINPPLSAAQFEKEFDSDETQKKYNYYYIQNNIEISFNLKTKQQDSRILIIWRQYLRPVISKFLKKYETLETMDHYNQIEQQQKLQKIKQKSTLWKSKIDQIKDTKQEFKQLKNIKKQIHSSSKRNSWSNIKTTNQDKPSQKK